MKNLTDKELKFVEEYISNGYVGSRAYKIAYSTDNNNLAKAEAWKLINRRPHIQEAISASEKSCRQISREIALDRKSILLELKKIIKGGYNAREKLASINILCKLTGAFSPKKSEYDLNFLVKKNINYDKLSQKEIKELETSILADL
jgi:hypothetical protein